MLRDPNSPEYSYWMLYSASSMNIILQNSSRGDWVEQTDKPPELPVRFYQVSDGLLGPVLDTRGLHLFREDLLQVIEELLPGSFISYSALVETVKGELLSDEYRIVIPHAMISLDELHPDCRGVLSATLSMLSGKKKRDTTKQPDFARISEVPEHCVISEEVCSVICEYKVADLEFSAPFFVG